MSIAFTFGNYAIHSNTHQMQTIDFESKETIEADYLSKTMCGNGDFEVKSSLFIERIYSIIEAQ